MGFRFFRTSLSRFRSLTNFGILSISETLGFFYFSLKHSHFSFNLHHINNQTCLIGGLLSRGDVRTRSNVLLMWVTSYSDSYTSKESNILMVWYGMAAIPYTFQDKIFLFIFFFSCGIDSWNENLKIIWKNIHVGIESTTARQTMWCLLKACINIELHRCYALWNEICVSHTTHDSDALQTLEAPLPISYDQILV